MRLTIARRGGSRCDDLEPLLLESAGRLADLQRPIVRARLPPTPRGELLLLRRLPGGGAVIESEATSRIVLIGS